MRLVYQRLCRKVLSRKFTLRMVRQKTADGPLIIGSTCKLRIHRWVVYWAMRGRSAKVRGQSAHGVFRRILTSRLIMSYKGIPLVEHIHLGAYEMFELDIYALVACYKMIEWIKWLVIKIELVWMDMIMRWHSIWDMIRYMSCEFIQISWHQVWFNLIKYSSIAQNLSFIENLSKLRR